MGIDNNHSEFDVAMMRLALQQAQLAEQQQEVPVGAVLVHQDLVIASGHNSMIQQHDPTAHAEMVVIRAAGKALQNYRLLDTTLYVTLEPCLMCCGAILQARIQRVVFSTTDPKTGALGSVINVLSDYPANHVFAVSPGCLAQDSAVLLRTFFQARRVGR